MRSRWQRRLAIVPLLLAAVVVHLDLPRVNLVLQLGDTLNAVRVLDPMQHTRLARLLDRLSDDDELARDLGDGRESLELIVHTPVLNAVAPREFRIPPRVAPAQQPQFELGELSPTPLTGVPARLLEIDLPPPRASTLWHTPGDLLPGAEFLGHGARAPPSLRA